MFWFYLDSKGRPTIANVGSDNGWDYSDSKDGTARELVAKSIKNKTYIFDDAGRMRTGLFYLSNVQKGSSVLDGYYYFTEDDDHSSVEGQMVTNKKVTVEIDGEDETFYFKKAGDAYTRTIISGSLYGANGRLVDDWGDGSTYEIVSFNYDIYTDKAGKNVIKAGEDVLINGNGKIKKSGTVTDINGMKVTVKDYIVSKQVDENGTTRYEADIVKTDNGDETVYTAVQK